MPSKSKEARLQQKTNFEKKLAERLSLLGEKGLDSKQITRDSSVRDGKGLQKEIQERRRQREQASAEKTFQKERKGEGGRAR